MWIKQSRYSVRHVISVYSVACMWFEWLFIYIYRRSYYCCSVHIYHLGRVITSYDRFLSMSLYFSILKLTSLNFAPKQCPTTFSNMNLQDKHLFDAYLNKTGLSKIVLITNISNTKFNNTYNYLSESPSNML